MSRKIIMDEQKKHQCVKFLQKALLHWSDFLKFQALNHKKDNLLRVSKLDPCKKPLSDKEA